LLESLGMIKALPDLTEREFLPRIETRIVLLQGSDRQRSLLASAFSKHVVEFDSVSAVEP
jgi:hypothetical protein